MRQWFYHFIGIYRCIGTRRRRRRLTLSLSLCPPCLPRFPLRRLTCQRFRVTLLMMNKLFLKVEKKISAAPPLVVTRVCVSLAKLPALTGRR